MMAAPQLRLLFRCHSCQVVQKPRRFRDRRTNRLLAMLHPVREAAMGATSDGALAGARLAVYSFKTISYFGLRHLACYLR
jgi:hypothetical protein